MTLTPHNRTALTSLAEQMAFEMSEHELLTEIGLRARTIALFPAAAGSVEKSIPEAAALVRAWDDLAEFGGWISRRLHRQLHSMHADGPEAVPSAATETASGHLTALADGLGIAPAIAVVVAALTLKRRLQPGWQETYRQSATPVPAAV